MTIMRKYIILTLTPCFFPFAYASQSLAEAEQVRLADEMVRLAQREAWRGVEQMYLQLQALELPLSHPEHLRGAHAAWERGDVQRCYVRLQAANADQATQEVIDWLWDIDQHYGQVELSGGRKGKAVLLREQPLVDRSQQRAVEVAAEQAREDGSFSGYLPSGGYSYGGTGFIVEPSTRLRVEVSGRSGRSADLPTQSSERPDSGSETYVPVGISRVDGDGREPWESVFDTDSSTSDFVIEKATMTSEAELLGPSGGTSRASSAALGPKRSRGLGAGLSVLSLGSAGFLGYQYTLTSDAHQRYLSASTDHAASAIWVDELKPAQQRMLASGVVGAVSLVSGSLLLLRTSTPGALELGLGPSSMHMSGRW